MEKLRGLMISGFCMILCALIMVVIGISQIRSEEPVGFYTGQKPPKAEDLSDPEGWNREHGIMWILYGVCILLSWIISLFIGNDILALLPLCAGTLLPMPLMMHRHKMLIAKYRIKRGDR